MELEYKRLREMDEREERQKKEDREFQLKLFSIFHQGSAQFTQPYYPNQWPSSPGGNV